MKKGESPEIYMKGIYLSKFLSISFSNWKSVWRLAMALYLNV